LEGVVLPWGEPGGYLRKVILPSLARAFKFDLNSAWRDLPAPARKVLLEGAPGRKLTFQYDSEKWHGEYESGWDGILKHVERRYRETASDSVGEQYILDEPSIGLHQRDNARLLETLKELRDLGNTVLVVEHDEETIRAADHVVDLGPRAGRHGGEVVVTGTLEQVLEHPDSLTARYLRGELRIPVPPRRRIPDPERELRVVGARQHNLRNLTVPLPLSLFIAVTGDEQTER